MENNWFNKTVQETEKNLETNIQTGLTQEQINALCQLYDSQIADLKRNISAKEQQLAKYKKK